MHDFCKKYSEFNEPKSFATSPRQATDLTKNSSSVGIEPPSNKTP